MSPREIVVNNPEVYFGKILTASSLLGNVYKAGKLWFVALINEGLTVQTWIKEHWTKVYSVKYLLELELFYFWPEIAWADSLGRPCIYWPRSLHLYSPITILYSTHNVLPIRLYISISSPKHFPWTPFHLTLPNMFRFRPIQPCCARKRWNKITCNFYLCENNFIRLKVFYLGEKCAANLAGLLVDS